MNENSTGELSGNETLNIYLQKGSNVKVRLASLNKFCFEDFVKKEKQKLIENNIDVVRHRNQRRGDRSIELRRKIYERLYYGYDVVVDTVKSEAFKILNSFLFIIFISMAIISYQCLTNILDHLMQELDCHWNSCQG